MRSQADKETRFRALLEENGDRIYRICCCYLRDHDAREDAYQTALMHIWESLDSFKGESQTGTWVFRITVNTCLGGLRSRKREQAAMQEALRCADPMGAAPNPRQDDVSGARQERELLYRCVHQLKPLEQTLVSLYLEDATSEQMAEVLGITPTNARVKLHRAKKQLKELWEEQCHGSR